MPERYSRVRQKMRRTDEDKWFIGIDYLVLLLVVGFGAVFTMTLTYTLDSPLTMIAMMQMIFALVGLVVFIFPAIYPEWNLRSGFPNKEDIEKMFRWFFILFPITLVVTVVVTLVDAVMMSTLVGPNLQIGLTSAIVEESLYGAGGGIIAFAVAYYVLGTIFGKNEMTRIMAEIIASAAIGFLFALSHLGAYGFVFRILAILFINRFIYQIGFYRTRNIMLPTLMHLVNNFIALALSLFILGG